MIQVTCKDVPGVPLVMDFDTMGEALDALDANHFHEPVIVGPPTASGARQIARNSDPTVALGEIREYAF